MVNLSAAHACEKRRKVGSCRLDAATGLFWTTCAWVLIAATWPLIAAAQQREAGAGQGSRAVAETRIAHAQGQEPGGQPAEAEHGAEEAQGESLFRTIARIVNAALLFGALVYFLRAPLNGYLESRQQGVRQDLVTATDLRKTAAEQLEELDQKMRKLPGDIEQLRRQGAEEIAQEEARITQAAETERQRLLEQTRREIDLQLRIAHRELIEHAAELAVGVATERIKKNITDQDQARLVDRYTEQLKKTNSTKL